MPFAPLILTLVLSSGPDLQTRRAEFKALLKEHWEYTLRESPEWATSMGDNRYNDRWTDLSLKHVAENKRATEAFLKRFKAVDTRGFPEAEALDRTLMVRQLGEAVEALSLGTYLMPVSQMGGPHTYPAEMVDFVPATTQKDADDYLARLRGVPKAFEDLTAVLREGRRRGLMTPAFLLTKVAVQCRAIAADEGEKSQLAAPLRRFPKDVADANRAAMVKAIDEQVRPAYLRLAEFVEKEYAPFGAKEPGLWAVPTGDRIYRFNVRQQTTTNLTPNQIHQTGLREVARIHAEMDVIARAQGFPGRRAYEASLKKDPKLVPMSGQAIIDRYNEYTAGIKPLLPKLFGRLPKAAFEVRPIPAFREATSSAAQYSTGAGDGSRPGIVYVNTGDFANRSLLSVESIAYHEGIPGHHMQLSIAQELTDLPDFRRNGGFGAYVEGWGLYSESLGKELGFYKDPASDYGRLTAELWRACRLVLDTGVHAKRWSREQMVAYFRDNTNIDEPNIQAETDRYIAIPGQALCYKTGQMEILALRRQAERELGSRFDIRAFHDEVLGAGSLPLDVLRSRIEAWIKKAKG